MEQSDEEDKNGPLLRAQTVYLYLGSTGRVSRSSRMQWFLDHLDSVVKIPQIDTIDSITKNLEILSIVPEMLPTNTWTPNTAHHFQYYIHSKTKLIFLSRRYCLTFCLDMSHSMSTVDILNGDVLLDRVFMSFQTCLEGVSRSFILPGSQLVFYPEIFVSVIANVNTPFFTTPAQQVLVQSWKVTGQNLQELSKAVHDGMIRLESAVADSFSQHENMVGPDQGFINMIRFGILALRLLPTSSASGMVIITDGVVACPDTWRLDATLARLRGSGIACHFVDVSSKFHANVAQGRIPYRDLMAFLSSASQAAYLTDIREASILDFRDLQMNHFHRSFLAWSFQDSSHAGEVSVNQELMRKKQGEENLNISLMKILCCRIREGYSVSGVNLSDTQIEVVLQLPWKHHIWIEYQVVSKWPIQGNKVHYTVFVLAPYDFLHDISCPKSRFQAPLRQAVVNRFWTTMKNLSQSDSFLVHLHSKDSNPSWNAIPDSVRSRMPLFYMSSGGTLTSNDVSAPQFASFWKQVSLLDADIWEKWVHVSRVALLLRHDSPLLKHLHLRNASGRFQPVQCRQSQTALHSLLTEIASFVLVENHSYVKIDGGTFCILRVTGRPPCVVLHVAYPCGVPEAKRAEMAALVRKHVAELSCPWRNTPSRSNSRVSSCLMLRKPVDKILVRYERSPATFETVVFPDGTQPGLGARGADRPSYLVTTLSRYLYHQRWIYDSTVSAEAVARILSTLTKIRLQEGFAFAHSQNGVVNMLQEAEAEVLSDSETAVDEDPSAPAARCVIQYVLFPPAPKREDDEPHFLVLETWVEPHSGLLRGLPYHRVGNAIGQADSAIISALLTFEHLALMTRDRGIGVPEPKSLPNEDVDARIRHEPFKFNVLTLLPHCRQAELLFFMPVRDWQVPRSKNVDSNSSLFDLIGEQFGKLHDRELTLSVGEAEAFLEHLFSRERPDDMKPLPLNSSKLSGTPNWRLYVRALSPLHLTLTVVPASYSDLKLLATEMQEDEFYDFLHAPEPAGSDDTSHQQLPGRSVSVEPQPSLDSWSDAGSAEIPRKPSFEDLLINNLENLMTQPSEIRQPFKPFRIRASSLDTNLEKARRMRIGGGIGGTSGEIGGSKRAASVREAAPEVQPPPPRIEAPLWSQPSPLPLHDTDPKPFHTLPLPVFVYDCPWQQLVNELLFAAGGPP